MSIQSTSAYKNSTKAFINAIQGCGERRRVKVRRRRTLKKDTNCPVSFILENEMNTRFGRRVIADKSYDIQ